MEALLHISPLLTLIATVCAAIVIVMRVNDALKELKETISGHEKRIRSVEEKVVRVETILKVESHAA
jgi:hypothetical protein